MKKTLILCAGLLASSFTISAQAAEALDTLEKKASYALAITYAQNLQSKGFEVDVEAFSQGLKDVLESKPHALSDDEKSAAMQAVISALNKKQIEMHKASIKANAQAGDKFRAEYAKKPGVITLDNGLLYKVIKSGNGESPTDDSTIFAHYKGSLINGKVFDSSYKRGTAFKFETGSVIRGWGEILKLMKPGDKWEVVIPPDLAYGERGAGELIGPNETLVFIIELISFTDSED